MAAGPVAANDDVASLVARWTDVGLAAAAGPIRAEMEQVQAENELVAGVPALVIASSNTTPVTEVSAMTEGREGETAGNAALARPLDPINARHFAQHVAIEMMADNSREGAREAALAAIGGQDMAAASIVMPTPPEMGKAVLAAHIRRLTDTLRTAAANPLSSAAA